MDQNEMIVMALAAGVSAFYALMVLLSSRRRGQKSQPAAAVARPVPERSEPTSSRPMASSGSDERGNQPLASLSGSERGESRRSPS